MCLLDIEESQYNRFHRLQHYSGFLVSCAQQYKQFCYTLIRAHDWLTVHMLISLYSMCECVGPLKDGPCSQNCMPSWHKHYIATGLSSVGIDKVY